MSNAVVPVEDLGRRMPEAGRIRVGKKTEGSRYPTKLETFRFTSTNETLILELAALYGGDVIPWHPSKGRNEYEVITAAKELPVILPPDPLGGTPIYELWAAGGIVRRCNGITATVSQRTPDGAEPAQVDCLCQAYMECKVTTRLSLVLADIRFAGTWRLETHSWFAAKELPGMVEAIAALQSAGYGKATLTTEPRTLIKDNQTRHFRVPVLRTDYTPSEIAEGQSHLAALAVATPHADQLALPRAPLVVVGDDDEVVEAEIVDEGEGPSETSAEPALPRGDVAPSSSTSHVPIVIKCSTLGLDDDARHAFCSSVSEGRTTSSKELTQEEHDRVMAVLRRIERGEVEYLGVAEDGHAIVKRKEPTT
jgi:hypothetical protein